MFGLQARFLVFHAVPQYFVVAIKDARNTAVFFVGVGSHGSDGVGAYSILVVVIRSLVHS